MEGYTDCVFDFLSASAIGGPNSVNPGQFLFVDRSHNITESFFFNLSSLQNNPYVVSRHHFLIQNSYTLFEIAMVYSIATKRLSNPLSSINHLFYMSCFFSLIHKFMHKLVYLNEVSSV